MTEVVKKIEVPGAHTASLSRKELKTGEYIEAVGRRKTASARIRITPAGKNTFMINGRTINSYFPTAILQKTAKDSLTQTEIENKFSVTAVVKGGGVPAQAEAVRQGVARCLVKLDPELRKKLKKAGFLKRDSRGKERKKFGLKGARRAPQWSKR